MSMRFRAVENRNTCLDGGFFRTKLYVYVWAWLGGLKDGLYVLDGGFKEAVRLNEGAGMMKDRGVQRTMKNMV